mmetsp:Transcript_71563/g.155499  ORF Transcript_71563/g.155499 Transcript_71563/m.155499 type:complete len:764 (+) Transcript_71563:68-2359(+)
MASQSQTARSKLACHPANRQFYESLVSRRESAEAVGRHRQAMGYARALLSLGRYPLPLKSSHDAAGLEGVGKAVAAIFQETLEISASQELAEPCEADCLAWRAATQRRFLRTLQRGFKGRPQVASATTPKQRKCTLSQGGSAVRSAVKWRRGSVGRSSPVGRCAAERRNHAQDPASTGRNEPAAPLSPSGTQHVGVVPGRPAPSAECPTSRTWVPASGSAAWCVLVALGLYADDAPDRALAWPDIQRCMESLRPLLHCDATHPSAIIRLKKRNLVEDFGHARWRLTALGHTIADGLVRKLEVPMTALSPLALQAKSSADENRTLAEACPEHALVSLDAENPECGVVADSLSDDDRPLALMAALSASLRHKPEAIEPSHQPCQQLVALDQPQHVHDVGFHSPSAAPGSLSQLGYRAPGSDACESGRSRETGCPAVSTSVSTPRRRKLQVTQSAPPLPAPQRRRLMPTLSAPPAPSAEMPQLSSSARLVLLLDHREVGAGRDHAERKAFLTDLASRLGIQSVEGRSLPLGDVLWVWRESEGQDELIAGLIVERKTFRDLSNSIVDGRYDEQKLRLLEAPGLRNVIYVVEGPGPLFGVGESLAVEGKPEECRGFGQRLLGRTLPARTLSTTAAHTQFISGFHVSHTTSTAHTVELLVALHEALQARGPPIVSAGSDVLYRDFAERTRKSCHTRVFEAFGRMLRMVPHCGQEATEALVDLFQTPHALATALRDCSDTELLLRIKAQRGGRAAVSRNVLAACRELFVA